MRLSICIPTHHGRLAVLKEAIESILGQITSDLKSEIEICVSDNASKDGTQEALEKYCRNYPDQIIYHRHSTNKGFPSNILNLVEMARGEYCWFLGSDDQIAEGGIALVLKTLEQYPDATGMTANRKNYDAFLYNEMGQDDWYLVPDNPEQLHFYTNADEIFTNCSVMHTYMSAQIFKREAWLEVVNEKGAEKFQYHSYYPHLYGIGAMILKYPKWLWLPDRIIKYRIGNDASIQHQNNRWHTHTVVVMDGLAKVWSELIGRRSPVYKTVMYKYFLFGWHPQGVRWLKSFHNYTFWDDLVMSYYYTKHLYFLPVFWLKTFPSLLIPHPLLKISYGSRLPLISRVYYGLRRRGIDRFHRFSGKTKASLNSTSASSE